MEKVTASVTTKIISYPEQYSRQIKIDISLKKNPQVDIDYCEFIQIFSSILLKSFSFSRKNDIIQIKTKTTSINKISYLAITISDQGLGDEKWRTDNIKNCNSFDIKELISKNKILFKHIDHDMGVKYCLLIPVTKRIKDKNKDNVIYLPLKRKSEK